MPQDDPRQVRDHAGGRDSSGDGSLDGNQFASPRAPDTKARASVGEGEQFVECLQQRLVAD
eukprot:4908290-Lingulodinium_polyedra.AAC.1